jgi:hypothetical protein
MKTFYSIVYASVRPVAQERISVGMLLSDGVQAKFACSPKKLVLLKKLLPVDAYSLLNQFLTGLEKELNIGSAPNPKLTQPGYWDYVSNYSNSFITFSAPEPVAVRFSEKTFKNLFEKFVFDYEDEVKMPAVFTDEIGISGVSKRLYPKIRSHVNINQSLTVNDIPTLLIPKIKVDFIGRNNRPVAGEIFDFAVGTVSLSNKIGQFISLIKSFELQKEKGKYFIIADEPDRVLMPGQFESWKHLHSSGLAEMISTDETERVTEYMKAHDVRPFVSN